MRRISNIFLLAVLVLTSLTSCSRTTDDQLQLSIAAAENDLPTVQRILEQKTAYVNGYVEGSDPALCVAAYAGNIEIVKILLDARADVNIRSPRGETPLMDAAMTDQGEIAKLLLARRADPKLTLVVDGRISDITALRIAEMKNSDHVSMLLK